MAGFLPSQEDQVKSPLHRFVKRACIITRRRPTLPVSCPTSTIGAGGLNCRVRYGNGCFPSAIVTWNLKIIPVLASEQSVCHVSFRPISTAQLNTLLCLHLRPINLLVSKGSIWRPRLEDGFVLRCLQRLSRPNLATQRCHWRDNWYTIGLVISVLSY